ncbi:MAG: Hsp20/alpha crystallin family protein [Salinirussus sp.]
MIREIGESIGNAVVESVGRAVSKAQERRPLPVDLLESEQAYLAVFDAPGAAASDVQVRFEEGDVVVRVDRFREFHEGFEMRFPGRGLALDGRVALPEGAAVDPSGATSTLKDNGTLQVRVPKRDPGSGAGSPVEVSEEIEEAESGES